MSFETDCAFRAAAESLQLVYSDAHPSSETDQTHGFDLSFGVLRGPAEPAKVKQLVELALRHASSRSYGQHLALLQLVTERRELEEFRSGALPRLFWRKPYHTTARTEPDRWVSLRTWLSDNGATPDLGPKCY